MISGNMWNLIRGAPYSGREEIISGNFGSQYVLETRIVATLCIYFLYFIYFILLFIFFINIPISSILFFF